MKTWFSNRSGTWLLMGALLGLCLAIGSVSIAQDEKKEETPPAATATETPAPTEAAKTEEPAKAEEKKEEEAPAAPAPAPPPTLTEVTIAVDTFLLLFGGTLVLFMQAGFAILETGLNSAKNAVNIMFKNFMDMCIGIPLYFFLGYGLMFPANFPTPNKIVPEYLEFGGVGIPTFDPATAAVGTANPAGFFFFQLAFAATAATIVSGAVAGRLKFSAYLMYSAFISALVYPISGFWCWGGGWLADMGFKDFAGSIVVHSVGGFAGLAGAILLGPRIGRFVNGKAMPIPGHNLTFAALGVFILWIGWYGFNPASQVLMSGIGNTNAVMYIAVTTTLGGAAGALVALAVSWAIYGKPDMTMALNGALAGLVGVTANCNAISYNEAFIIGGIAGVIVVMAIILLEKLQIDDPVGAFPVHGCCGLWGGIATGIFADGAVMTTQIIGTLVVCAWAFGAMFAFFALLKIFGQLRVSKEEELEGLDISEHGMYAYPAHTVHEGASSHAMTSVSSAKTPVSV